MTSKPRAASRDDEDDSADVDARVGNARHIVVVVVVVVVVVSIGTHGDVGVSGGRVGGVSTMRQKGCSRAHDASGRWETRR